MFEKSIYIFHRSLRLQDNIGLLKALELSKHVIPIFIFTPEQIDKNDFKSHNAIEFMIECLKDLNKKLKKKNSKLFIYYGKQHEIIKKMLKKDKSIECIFVNKDYTKYAVNRENKISKECENNDVKFYSYEDYLLHPVNSVKTGNDDFYSVFTPFYNKIKLLTVDKPQTNLPNKFISNKYKNIKTSKFSEIEKIYNSDRIDEVIDSNIKVFNGSRKDGISTKNNLKNHKNYSIGRNELSENTTLLSAHIKFGTISIREVYHKLKKLYGLNDPIIRQLYWREFYFTIAYNRPDIFDSKSFKEKYDKIKWKKSKKLFDLWKNGNTGYPIIDASMRELNQTGYMHNRGRLITSNFLVKILNLDWRQGEKYFAQKLVDYDPAVNNGNWQWTAGSGADSQQYIRIYNPWTQGERHDKNAEYIKKWIPELTNVDAKDIHNWNEYYDLHKDIQYPKPVIEYKKYRKKALDIYKKALK
jgi:deoxyribodipyrimidine photo-lyase